MERQRAGLVHGIIIARAICCGFVQRKKRIIINILMHANDLSPAAAAVSSFSAPQRRDRRAQSDRQTVSSLWLGTCHNDVCDYAFSLSLSTITYCRQVSRVYSLRSTQLTTTEVVDQQLDVDRRFYRDWDWRRFLGGDAAEIRCVYKRARAARIRRSLIYFDTWTADLKMTRRLITVVYTARERWPAVRYSVWLESPSYK